MDEFDEGRSMMPVAFQNGFAANIEVDVSGAADRARIGIASPKDGVGVTLDVENVDLRMQTMGSLITSTTIRHIEAVVYPGGAAVAPPAFTDSL